LACSSCQARREALLSEASNVNDFFNGFVGFVKRPYSEEMSALDWFLFLGLVVVIIFAWKSILNKVLD